MKCRLLILLITATSMAFASSIFAEDDDPPPPDPEQNGDPEMTASIGAGGDTPTGASGSFSGSIQTGAGSFDPYERNASRTITDIVVPGAVIPFTYTRTWNSRSSSHNNYSLLGSGWHNNWSWGLEDLWYTDLPPGTPPNDYFHGYKVHYPDGRVVQFNKPSSPAHAPPGGDGTYTPMAPGVVDRFVVQSGAGQLFISDGSVVNFSMTCNLDWDATSIVDPHGLIVTITFVPNLGVRITEPGGRYIQIGAIQGYGTNLQSYTVTTSLGQSVTYTITRTDAAAESTAPSMLEDVTYNDVIDPVTGGPVAAHYVYLKVQPPTLHPPDPPPPPVDRLVWASDPMFEGPLQQVRYTYVGSTGDPARTAVLEERYAATSASTDTGVLVFRCEMLPYTYTPYPGPGYSEGYWTRNETRGDGPSRTISYFNTTYHLGQMFVDHVTDFVNPAYVERHTYDWTHYFQTPIAITDMRGKLTTQTLESVLGHITQITHPAPGGTYRLWTYSDSTHPYYVATTTDENGHQTRYTRDSVKHLITRIDYPDGGFETFTYNNFNQVRDHVLTGGGTESFTYGSTGLKSNHTAPATPSDPNPQSTQYFYYSSNSQPASKSNLLWLEIDPLGHQTTYDYNGRGQITRVTHDDGTYIQNAYNGDGTLAWTADENHPEAINDPTKRTRYVYDEYNRVTSITDPTGHITTKSYTPWDGSNRLSHISSFVFHEVSGAGKVTDQDCDANFRPIWKRQGTGADAVTTTYHYDAVGNMDWIQDPNLHTTTYTYDERDRKQSMIPPAPYNTQVTTWQYDGVGNMTRENRPDNTFRQVEYNAMNRIWKEHQPRLVDGDDLVTTYIYFHSGMLQSVQDPKGQTTLFTYDARNLKSTMTYPNNVTVQGWRYDAADNLIARPTADGSMTQFFQYDNRNRVNAMRWSNGMDFSDFVYDAANHLTSAVNPYSTITRQYDNAGRLTLDRQVLAASSNTAATAVVPQSVVSRLTHGSAGSFDIPLPFAAGSTPGIECRSASGNYTLVLNFTHSVKVVGATVNSGIGSVASLGGSGTTAITVNLTGVSDAQRMTVKIFGLADGSNTGEVTVPMHVLIGDTNGNGSVNASDESQTSGQSSLPVSTNNFRCDVNASGGISSSDIALVKARSGDLVPDAPLPGPTFDVSYEYDNDGRVSRLFLQPANIYDFHYSYDGLGRLEGISQANNGSPSYQYTYDDASNVLERNNIYGNSRQTFSYDVLNQKSERDINATYYDPNPPYAAHPYLFSKEQYGYDAMGRLHWRVRTLTGPDATLDLKEDAFGYNANGELTYADYDRPGTAYDRPARVVNYTLDHAGNRTAVSDWISGVTNVTGYTPNNLNQYSNLADNGTEHEVSAYQGVSYHYLGDTRLASASQLSDGSLYELGYDALGRCVRRTTNHIASYFAYDGEREILECDGGGGLLSYALYGIGVDEVIVRLNHGSWQLPFQDYLGSTSAIAIASGEIKEQYRYDAFGTPEFRSGPVAGDPRGTLQYTGTLNNNRVLFTGRQWMARYGFYEYRARAYNPDLGRFMSEDPMGFKAGDKNLFRYCGNDPIDRIDPMGLLSGFSHYVLLNDGPVDATHDGWEVHGVDGTQTKAGDLKLSVDRNVSRQAEVTNDQGQKVAATTKLAAKADTEGIHVGIDVKYATAKSAGPNAMAKAAQSENDHSQDHIKWANGYRDMMAPIVKGMSPVDAADRITSGKGRGYSSDSLENRRHAEVVNSSWKHDSPIRNPHWPDHWTIDPKTDKPYRLDQ